MKARPLGLGVMMMSALLCLTGCGVFADTVTDCHTSTETVMCQRDERFDLAGTSIVVDELETITVAGNKGEEEARVEAHITLDGEPTGAIRAQLHVTGPVTDEELIIDSDRELTESGERTVTWDLSGHGYAERIQFDYYTPIVFIVFSDGEQKVTVNVIRVQYIEDGP